MTVIIGIESPTGTALVSDGQFSLGGGLKFLGRKKIIRIGDILYGFSGDGSFSSKVQFGCELPSVYDGSINQEKWVYQKVVPILKDAQSSCDSAEWDIIVATKSEIVVIDSHFDVYRSRTGFVSVGSGSPYALGVLTYVKTKKNYVDLSDAIEAVIVASKNDIDCDSNVEVLENNIQISQDS